MCITPRKPYDSAYLEDFWLKFSPQTIFGKLMLISQFRSEQGLHYWARKLHGKEHIIKRTEQAPVLFPEFPKDTREQFLDVIPELL